MNRYRKRKAEEELADTASYEIERGGTGFGTIIAGIHRKRAEDALEGLSDPFEVEASPTEQSFVSSVSCSLSSTTTTTGGGGKQSSSRELRIEAGLAKNFPSWMNPEVARHSMTRRARKNLPQAHLSRLVKKMDKTYYQDRYKAAFKAATVAGNIPESEKGKHGTGVDAICERINKEMLMSPADRKLAPSTVHRAIQRGEFGISPPTAGRKSTLPKEFTKALAVHSVMMQVSGEGEMSSIKMRTLATAMTLGTPHEGKLTNAHIWKTTRHRHPEYIKPANAVDNEDRRVDWLTYKNIMLWMQRAKKFVLDIEMAKDEPGLIRKCVCLCYIFILPLTSRQPRLFSNCRWRPERGYSCPPK